MSNDFANNWAAALGPEDSDPKVQQQRELDKLYMLATAAATQAHWNASKKSIIFSVLGYIFVPTMTFYLALNLATNALTNNVIIAFAAILGYFLGGLAVFHLAKRIPHGDPSEELKRTIVPLLQADDLYRQKWGKPKRTPGKYSVLVPVPSEND